MRFRQTSLGGGGVGRALAVAAIGTKFSYQRLQHQRDAEFRARCRNRRDKTWDNMINRKKQFDAAITKKIEEYRTENRIPAISVAISVNTKLVYNNGVGCVDLENGGSGEGSATDMKVNVAGITKLFTAHLFMVMLKNHVEGDAEIRPRKRCQPPQTQIFEKTLDKDFRDFIDKRYAPIHKPCMVQSTYLSEDGRKTLSLHNSVIPLVWLFCERSGLGTPAGSRLIEHSHASYQSAGDALRAYFRCSRFAEPHEGDPPIQKVRMLGGALFDIRAARHDPRTLCEEPKVDETEELLLDLHWKDVERWSGDDVAYRPFLAAPARDAKGPKDARPSRLGTDASEEEEEEDEEEEEACDWLVADGISKPRHVKDHDHPSEVECKKEEKISVKAELREWRKNRVDQMLTAPTLSDQERQDRALAIRPFIPPPVTSQHPIRFTEHKESPLAALFNTFQQFPGLRRRDDMALNVAAHIVERQSGESFRSFAARHLRGVGLRDTYLHQADEVCFDQVTGYNTCPHSTVDDLQGRTERGHESDYSNRLGSAAIFTTSRDLVKFADLYLRMFRGCSSDSKLFSKERVTYMWSFHAQSKADRRRGKGFAWDISYDDIGLNESGKTVYRVLASHTGVSLNGFSSFLGITCDLTDVDFLSSVPYLKPRPPKPDPERHISVFATRNREDGRWYFGEKLPPPRHCAPHVPCHDPDELAFLRGRARFECPPRTAPDDEAQRVHGNPAAKRPQRPQVPAPPRSRLDDDEEIVRSCMTSSSAWDAMRKIRVCEEERPREGKARGVCVAIACNSQWSELGRLHEQLREIVEGFYEISDVRRE